MRQRRRDRDAVQAVHIAHQFVAQAQDVLHLLEALVLARGILEEHFLTQAIARVPDGFQQRAPIGAQEIGDAHDFGGILRRAYHLLAGAQAHRHLAIDAAGVRGRGHQVFLAAAHLEEIEELRLEALGGGARAEGSEIQAGGACEVAW